MTTQHEDTTQLNEQGLSISSGYIQVYHIDPQTREYIGSTQEYLMEGIGIPAHSFPDAPPQAQPQQAILRRSDASGWDSVADYRGKTVYDKQTRQASVISQPGDLPDTLTLLAPASAYDVWQADGWVTDDKAQQAAQVSAAQQQMAGYLAQAEKRLAVLQYAVELEMATEQETQALKNWKTYMVQLSRLDVSSAPAIDWPTMPA
ncbi:tail fiber assembly protein [Dickeya dianthicola]|uniref:Phage tail protein n=1 Tax=Dickeya dianthicola TaxID=204039 RepID=A0AAP6S042_9GAMM|nr:tail fiber assembly protein [Dickeya dianthicola]MBI0438537.1 tail fiber assembly protein [Dickeya dianthicola]MBI0448923.1 tail fiber assembly protein [Dickeya dianthicola]MBI0453634.1 tail fiber assembly protein [Dickeya dianthicola]MBI0457798.1 tail fiber assembly protein [Dickeya dianthicola]MBI0462429.1 tail fiber assembly protein [Dickeya dianthicola]